MTPFDDLPPDVEDVAERLSDERPRPAPGQLGAVRARVFKRKSRFGTMGATAVLGLGVLMTGSGVSVAVSDIASPRQTPVQAQYPTTPTETPTTQTTQNTVENRQNQQAPPPPPPPPSETVPVPTDDDIDVLGEVGEVEESAPAPADDSGAAPTATPDAPVTPEQAQQQAGGGDESLPFTGFAAIPLVGLGALLMGAGVALRRRLEADQPS